jgi:chromosome segregation ATPase
MRMMMGGRGNTPGGTQGQDQSQEQDQSQNQSQRSMSTTRGSQDENLQALQTLLEDKNATSDEIKAKLSVLRKAREAAKQELAQAQRELRELLTLRQEAMLVVMGLLE